MQGPNRKFEQIFIRFHLVFGIWCSVLEGMHRCICSFNHSITEMKGSESDNRYSGSVAGPTLTLAGNGGRKLATIKELV